VDERSSPVPVRHHGGMTAPGLPPSEEFRNATTWKQQVPVLGAMLAVLVLLMWLILGAVLSAVGLPGARWIALVLAVGIGAAMWVARKKGFEKAVGQAVLVASGEGLEVQEPYRRIRLRWVDMTDIGAGPAQTGYRTPGSTGRRVQAMTAAATARSTAVYGPTQVELSPQIPALQKANIDQKAREQRPHVDLGAYAPDFPAGRLGEWFRAQRPDLLG